MQAIFCFGAGVASIVRLLFKNKRGLGKWIIVSDDLLQYVRLYLIYCSLSYFLFAQGLNCLCGFRQELLKECYFPDYDKFSDQRCDQGKIQSGWLEEARKSPGWNPLFSRYTYCITRYSLDDDVAHFHDNEDYKRSIFSFGNYEGLSAIMIYVVGAELALILFAVFATLLGEFR